MNIEYEATFPNVDKEKVREQLKKAGARLVRPEYEQKRVVFHLPTGHEIEGGWVRVRDEGDKVTMSLKVVNGDKIEDQKEICLKVDDFDEGVNLLLALGCTRKSYQETKRELWQLEDVEITFDEWPFLLPFVEVEGKSEGSVRKVSEKVGFDYATAIFGAVDELYKLQYPHLTSARINNETPVIAFDRENPFLQ